ncbi:MAG: glycosyltransferase family 2 protein [Armatimonadetes bacterium]|nr:glycosyltransferase family 2 protein [Armatimonadota bacterium]
MPAYRAAKTLRETYLLVPNELVHSVILVDDGSPDETFALARELSIKAIRHPHNVGYGGNQKTCYMEALRDLADVVVMLHPDGQYDPQLIPELVRPVLEGEADLTLGSRFLIPGAAKEGGMPLYKRIANRILSGVENVTLGLHLSEYHTGYRAYSRKFLETVPFLRNSNDFVFDSQVIFQAVAFGLPVKEVPARSRYFKEASSVGFRTSVVYGISTLWWLTRYLLHRFHIVRCSLFSK